MKGYLLFKDGTKMEGLLVGAYRPTIGELVFNTSMTGYQEILTDPSYHRQVVVLTHPEIGNYGVQEEVSESDLGHAAGMIFRNLSPGVWHRSSEQTFHQYLSGLGVSAITSLDTRKLTHLIRDKGPQNVMILPEEYPMDRALEELHAAASMEGASLAPEVSTTEFRSHGTGKTHIVLIDYGIKIASVRALLDRDCRITQVPWDTPFEAIQRIKPDGVLLSNGPGDPAAIPLVADIVKDVIDHFPTMGICLGFQLMARAMGGRTYKLPFGHRGGNHPVKYEGRVVITSQNHGFAVDPESLDPELVDLTHYSLFDQSLEGFKMKHKPVFGVQFHPEAAPGPHDCLDHFDYFLSLVRGSNA